jgi:hypothetical protein
MITKDRYRFSNGKTSYEYHRERINRLKELKRVNKILSVDYFSNNKSEVNDGTRNNCRETFQQ